MSVSERRLPEGWCWTRVSVAEGAHPGLQARASELWTTAIWQDGNADAIGARSTTRHAALAAAAAAACGLRR